MRYFAADPAGSMATLEEMYRSSRADLVAEALQVLEEPGEHPGQISLIAFLAKKQELLPLLKQVALPWASRLLLAKLALRVDPDLDQALAREILSSHEPQLTQDLLEILSQTRVRAEVVERLAPLLRSPHPRVHSKMAFLMARVAPEGAWVTEGLADPDPRVRANIVEALWHQKSPFANAIFQQAAADPHHRVAANAIHGLYLQGDPAALPKIRHLLLDTGGLDRRAGLWLLERTRDPRYVSLLGKLIGKVEPEARTRCLKVIQASKSRKEQAVQRGRIAIEWFPGAPGHARFTATLAGRRLTSLHPFDVILHAGGQVVDHYSLKARSPAPRRQVVLLTGECPNWGPAWRESLPAPVSAAPSPDRFGFLHYAPEPQDPAIPEVAFSLLGVNVTAAKTAAKAEASARPTGISWCGPRLASLRRAFDQPVPAAADLNAALRQAAAQVDLAAAETHFVVLDEIPSPVNDLPEKLQFDVLTTRFDEGLAARCARHGGSLQVVTTVDQAVHALERLERSWHASYDVAFPAPVTVDHVEVFSESGYGEFVVKMVGAQGLEPRASSV
ncbi:MAG: HEAT repeat domain-containing protein [Bryobacteraceae bacterium]|nr:HEAT repeat domain-containing protein [Bryobacteraceae bacterium]